MASASFTDPTTWARTRGEVTVKPASYVADVDIDGAFGMCIVSSDAFAVGITAIPGPFSDAGWDGWFMWRSFARHFEFASGIGIESFASWPFEVDSKAMRKIPSEGVMVEIAESRAGAFEIAMHTRGLLLLS